MSSPAKVDAELISNLKLWISCTVTFVVGCFVLYRVLLPVLMAGVTRIVMGMLADAGIVVGKDI